MLPSIPEDETEGGTGSITNPADEVTVTAQLDA
jgi:hypothetical protein